jgi:hypothetical protein
VAKFEDNLSPYLTVVEQGSTPANPSSGDQKLFVRTSDHVLCYVNSSGTVTPIASSGAGTGNAGAVYAMGNGAAIWNAGASFPGSKATGDRYWRTDLGMEFYWDGTRWLSTTLHSSAGFPVDTGGGQPISSPLTVTRFPTWNGAFDIWLVSVYYWIYVSTTNDGSHYWTLDVQKNPGGTSLGTGTTAALTVATHTGLTVAYGVALGTGTKELDLVVSKTSTPGALFCVPNFTYRLIGA